MVAKSAVENDRIDIPVWLFPHNVEPSRKLDPPMFSNLVERAPP